MRNSASGIIGVQVIMWVCMSIIMGIIGIFLWPYSINTWLEFIGKEPVFTATQGFILGLIPGIGWSSIAIAVFTWILMLFL